MHRRAHASPGLRPRVDSPDAVTACFKGGGTRVSTGQPGCRPPSGAQLRAVITWSDPVARHLDTVEVRGTEPRPPRCTRILAESAGSRPSRYAVASRAWTRQPQPRRWQLREGRGRNRNPQATRGPANGFANETQRDRVDAARGAIRLRSPRPGQRDAAACRGPARRASWCS